MENASKALLIAAAILIVLLIIGFGIMVLNSSTDNIDEGISQMSTQQKDMFNKQFTIYEGPKVTGNSVRSLIQNIISSNNTNQDIDGKIVSIDGIKSINAASGSLQANEMSLFKTEINTGATYKVVMSYNDKTGLVTKVTITKN